MRPDSEKRSVCDLYRALYALLSVHSSKQSKKRRNRVSHHAQRTACVLTKYVTHAFRQGQTAPVLTAVRPVLTWRRRGRLLVKLHSDRPACLRNQTSDFRHGSVPALPMARTCSSSVCLFARHIAVRCSTGLNAWVQNVVKKHERNRRRAIRKSSSAMHKIRAHKHA